MNLKIAFTTLFLILVEFAFSQTQTIRGTIVDIDSKSPLIGATVRVMDTEELLGGTTDLEGNFRISNVPHGRQNLLVTSIGYEDKFLPNILVTAAKEVVLKIEIAESIRNLEEVIIVAQKDKGEVLNEMALVSARSFSVEETNRYAGSFSDPARMVSAFAGVSPDAEGDNDIVVRGNSPRGILWRLEGVEIPNPNHFAAEGSTGGPVNALNSNMLDNSDFYTGAFAPEYGNALSGVFDIRFKNGNNEQREYTLSASMLGIDFTGEGPFSKNYDGSYIVNYRYSSLQLLTDLGILDFGGVPKYQDASFKLNLPINSQHKLSVFGLGGISSITAEEFHDNGDKAYRGRFDSDLGIMGLSHIWFPSQNTFLKNTISVSGSRLEAFDDYADDSGEYYKDYRSDISKNTIRAITTLNHKFNAQHKTEAGVILSRLGYNADADAFNHETDVLEKQLSENDAAYVVQGFGSWKYRITDEITLTSGLHYTRFTLNGSESLEPRVAGKWQLDAKNSVFAGFGMHSRMESIATYLARSSDGLQINKDLGLTKSAHWVAGYGYKISPFGQLKAELYYQHLYNVPVENEPGSNMSVLNVSDTYITDPLVNQGTGRNFGVELTWERFFHQGYYYMATASLYQSYYTAMNGIERSTAFNGNYIVNFTGGKEFQIGNPMKNRVFFVNTKISLLGGGRYTPIDLEESRELGSPVYQEDRPFAQKAEDVFFMNLALGIRRNKKNTTREFKIDVTNITNNQAVIREYYIQPTEEVEQSTQLPFIPNIVYSFKF